jgi:catechol 2,3-dioxygenase-like lactoylglutathione lyase family enzyme
VTESPEITFDGLNLVCGDVDATLAFYRTAGVPIPAESVWRTATGAHHVPGVRVGGGAAELEFDSHALAHEYNAGTRDGGVANAVLGFRVASRAAVDELHGRLVAAGYRSRQVPFDAFWGSRYAIVADPDGRDVGFMSPRDDTLLSQPPDL